MPVSIYNYNLLWLERDKFRYNLTEIWGNPLIRENFKGEKSKFFCNKYEKTSQSKNAKYRIFKEKMEEIFGVGGLIAEKIIYVASRLHSQFIINPFAVQIFRQRSRIVVN